MLLQLVGELVWVRWWKKTIFHIETPSFHFISNKIQENALFVYFCTQWMTRPFYHEVLSERYWIQSYDFLLRKIQRSYLTTAYEFGLKVTICNISTNLYLKMPRSYTSTQCWSLVKCYHCMIYPSNKKCWPALTSLFVYKIPTFCSPQQATNQLSFASLCPTVWLSVSVLSAGPLLEMITTAGPNGLRALCIFVFILNQGDRF